MTTFATALTPAQVLAIDELVRCGCCREARIDCVDQQLRDGWFMTFQDQDIWLSDDPERALRAFRTLDRFLNARQWP